MSTKTPKRTHRYPLGLGVLVLVAVLLSVGVEWLGNAMVANSASWVPMIGTPGQTILVYNLIVTLFTLILVPSGAFWLGMQYGQQDR